MYITNYVWMLKKKHHCLTTILKVELTLTCARSWYLILTLKIIATGIIEFEVVEHSLEVPMSHLQLFSLCTCLSIQNRQLRAWWYASLAFISERTKKILLSHLKYTCTMYYAITLSRFSTWVKLEFHWTVCLAIVLWQTVGHRTMTKQNL